MGSTDNEAAGRYELEADGHVAAVLMYRDRQGRRVLVHTEVDPAFEGRGLGTTIVRETLDDVRRRGLKIVPLCPFVREYLERHPEDADLVAA